MIQKFVKKYNFFAILMENKHIGIYRAIRKEDLHKVILKHLNPSHPNLDDIVDLQHEKEILQNLKIPGVLNLLGTDEFDNSPVLVFEDFNGIFLKDYLEKEKLQPFEFLQVAIRLTKIVEELHSYQIFHREINPYNILIDPVSKDVRLTNFRHATEFIYVKKDWPVSPNHFKYISPEQTGRMNRKIDYRSDLYSLGATFYEMVTGAPLFEQNNATELIYQHMTKNPIAAHVKNPSVPEAISEIISKLLTKIPEERYQSALSLKYDLEVCLQQLRNYGQVKEFIPAGVDRKKEFQIPSRLYSRDKEIHILNEAYEKCVAGDYVWLLISGYAGIGKTALVHELKKTVESDRGYFIEGKYDQLQRDIPYSGIIMAFRDLIHQILVLPEQQLEEYKRKINEALSPNGKVLSALIPELELIIGSQPPVGALNPQETQNRLNLVVEKFLSVFATSETPLVIFIDDLQWATQATFNLMKGLIENKEIHHLLFIGSYRSQEMDASHPLSVTIEEIIKEGGKMRLLELSPLDLNDVNQFVADTSSCTIERAMPLTTLLYRKTGGNPFFLVQFIKNLYRENLFYFNPTNMQWEWNLQNINEQRISDNVIDLMIKKIDRLPVQTQKLLTLAAVIGETFDFHTFAAVADIPEKMALEVIWKAVDEELIIPIGGFNFEESLANSVKKTLKFKFIHDRIQQAAISNAKADEICKIHHKIGNYYLRHEKTKQFEELLMETVFHLNAASRLLTTEEEKIKLAELDLQACRKAKASSAFTNGFDLASKSLSLLSEKDWKENYALTYAIHLEMIECAYPAKKFNEIDSISKIILAKAKTKIDKGNLYILKINYHTNISKTDEALNEGIECLRLFDIYLTKYPSNLQVLKVFLLLKWKMRNKSMEDLEHLPEMENPEKLFLMRLMINMCPAAFISNKNLLMVLDLLMMNLTLDYGNSEFAFFIYATYAGVLEIAFRDYPKAFQFGELSLRLSERYNLPSPRCRANYVMAIIISHWMLPLNKVEKYMNACHSFGLESGELLFTSFISVFYGFLDGAFNTDLEKAYQKISRYQNSVSTSKNEQAWNSYKMKRQIALKLQEGNFDGLSLTGPLFDEEEFLNKIYHNHELEAVLQAYTAYKGAILYLFGHLHQALDLYEKAKSTTAAGLTLLTERELNFYYAMTLAALYPESSFLERWKKRKIIKKIYKLHKLWTKCCPENNSHRLALIAGELAKLAGKKKKAFAYFEEAIELAKQNHFTGEEGLAYELCGKLYLAENMQEKAKLYLGNALYCYSRWGAASKVTQLQLQYPEFLKEKDTLIQNNAPLAVANESIFDIDSIMKASAIISSEVNFKTLLEQLMTIVVKNAGADKALLFLTRDGEWLMQAETTDDLSKTLVLGEIPISEYHSKFPIPIFNYVLRLKETVYFNRPSEYHSYANDSYLKTKAPKSLLCMPIVNRENLIGILYLENSSVTDVFFPDKVKVLHLLSMQIAASIENSLLYESLKKATATLQETNVKLGRYQKNLEEKINQKIRDLNVKNRKLQETMEKLKTMEKQVMQEKRLTDIGSLSKGIAHEIKNPLNFIDNFSSISLDMLHELEEQKVGVIEQESVVQSLKENFHKIELYSKRALGATFPMLKHDSSEGTQFLNVDMNQIISFRASALNEKIQLEYNSAIKVSVNLDKNLKDIRGIPLHLVKGIKNILDNSCYALGEKMQQNPSNFQPTIDVETKSLGDALEIIIKDNGTGISQNHLDKIFTPFFTTKPTGIGTGLGLAAAYDIFVREHQGKISVDSIEGKYTEFHIVLPYRL